jgi:hypothetical protein
MKIMPLKKYLCLSFSLIWLQAYAAEVAVPAYLQGVAPDAQALKGHHYVYQVQGKLSPQVIHPRHAGSKTIEALVNSLFFSYINNDKALFLSLHAPIAQQELSRLSASKFNAVWTFMQRLKSPRIDFYFHHQQGVVIGLKSMDNVLPELLYAVKVGEEWKIDLLKIDKSDERFTNISLYLTYRPFEVKPVKLLKGLKKGDVDLSLKMQTQYPWINLLKKVAGKWEMKTFLQDNAVGKYRLDDLDPAQGMIKVEFRPDHFRSDEAHEILILESTFPLTSYPLEFFPEGQVHY